MSITGNFVDGLAKIKLKHVGVNQTPRLLVIHYSVTDTVAAAVTALDAATLGYHILIEKDGTAFQTRRFTESAAHPGLSNWKSDSGVTLGASVSRGSIGICMMNKGFAFGGSPSAPGKLIYNPNDASMQHWEVYPDKLVASCRRIAQDILATYPVTAVVGHHDVAIMGKFDPGPLFDLKGLDDLTPNPKPLGFRTTVNSPDGTLTVREETNSGSKALKVLHNGDVVHIRSIAYGPKADCIHPSPGSRKRYLTRWASVDIDASNTHAGFVNMKFLASTPLDPGLAAFL
ncbi:MAG: N-acetylmuramoyl-L-alanine amidase [Rhizobiaceae bacterium]|nr:N-acetylmuramoyl-L-alanine amidase [Rhizobiaceae bacterium]